MSLQRWENTDPQSWSGYRLRSHKAPITSYLRHWNNVCWAVSEPWDITDLPMRWMQYWKQSWPVSAAWVIWNVSNIFGSVHFTHPLTSGIRCLEKPALGASFSSAYITDSADLEELSECASWNKCCCLGLHHRYLMWPLKLIGCPLIWKQMRGTYIPSFLLAWRPRWLGLTVSELHRLVIRIHRGDPERG